MPRQAARCLVLLAVLVLGSSVILWRAVHRQERQTLHLPVDSGVAAEEVNGKVALGEAEGRDDAMSARSGLPRESPDPVEEDRSQLDRLADVLAELSELDRTQDDPGFYPEATKLVLVLAEILSTLGTESTEPLDEALADPSSSMRFRSSLYLGCGLSRHARFDEHSRRAARDPAEDSLIRMGAVLGMALATEASHEAIYAVSEYFGAARSRRLHTFELLLARKEPALETVGELLRIVEESGVDLRLREAALLVAGQGIDTNRAVQQHCFSILTGDQAGEDSLLPAAAFVIAHAQSPHLVNALVEISTTSQNTLASESMLHALARYGNSMAAAQALIRFGTDPNRSGLARGFLVLSLGKMLNRLGQDADRSEIVDFIVNELALIGQNDPDPLVRLAALGALTSAPVGRGLSAIESALFHDLDASIRADAASIVQEATPDAATAAALLTKAYHSEPELSVRIKIVKALVKLGHESSAELFAMIVAGDPSEALIELAKTGLAKLESK